MAKGKITIRDVMALKPGQTIWDSETPGFGVRCRGKARTYVLKRRQNGVQVWATIGRHGDGIPDQARKEVLDLQGLLEWAPEAARSYATFLAGKVKSGKKPKDKSGPSTVRDAVMLYIQTRKERDLRAGEDAARKLGHHVLGAPIADVALKDLEETHFQEWRAGLTRGGRGKEKRGTKAGPISPATRARIFADLRAALNAAAIGAKLEPSAFVAIARGLRRPKNADVPRTAQVLNNADVRKIVGAALDIDADFGMLVVMLAATGARLRQLASVRVGDVQIGNRRVLVPVSSKGRGEKAKTHIPIPLPDDVLDRLRPLLNGRAGHETLLMRWQHRQVRTTQREGAVEGGSNSNLPVWERTERRSWAHTADMARAWKVAVQRAELPSNLVPYCLRHSSIVRMLMGGVPVRMAAAAHDTSVAMIEKHYSAYIIEADDEVIRRAIVPMTSGGVVAIRPARVG